MASAHSLSFWNKAGLSAAFLAFAVLLPVAAHAQATTTTTDTGGATTRITSNSGPCAATPGAAKCLSFDPAVNPLLTGFTPSSRAGFTLTDGSTCRYYDGHTSLGQQFVNFLGGNYNDTTGCLSKDGKTFTFSTNTTIAADGGGSVPGAAAPTTGSDFSNSNGQTGTSVSNPTVPDGDCSLINGNLQSCLSGIIFGLIKLIAFFFFSLAATVLGIVGVIFNWTIYITVFQFGNLIGNNPGMLAAWGVLRDVGNILLLFGFIFMGISTILNLPHNEFTAKRALPALIIFAVLMNFSLFAAEAVIDVSNGLGSTLYNQAGNGLCPAGVSNLLDCATNYGIAGKVMQVSGITTIFTITKPESWKAMNHNDVGSTIGLVGLTVLAAVLAFVLLAAVFMLIGRAVLLAFLMAVSPIGFAGMAIPPLHGLAQQWWDQLIKQAFFAPVYILLILVSVKFMEGMSKAIDPSATSLADVFTADGISNVSMVIIFLLIIGLLLAATQVAKSMSAVGAGAATKMAGATVFGGMARISNYGIGASSRFARTQVQRATGNSKNAFVRSIGVGASNVLRGGEKVNTDFRGFVPGLGVAGGPAQHATYEDMQHQIHEVRANVQEGERQFDREVATRKLVEEAHGLKPGDKLSPESERFLAGLSADQIAADHNLVHSMDTLASKLSPDQFEGLMKSDKVSETEKGKMRDARYKPLGAQIASSDGSNIRKWSNKDLEQFFASPAYSGMDDSQKKEFISLLSDDQYNNLNGSSKLLGSQKETLQDARRNARFDLVMVPDPKDNSRSITRLERTMRDMNSEKRAKIDDDILVRKEVIAQLNPADLDAIRRADKLTEAQREEIGKYIDNVMTDGDDPKHKQFSVYEKTVSANTWRSLKAFYNITADDYDAERA